MIEACKAMLLAVAACGGSSPAPDLHNTPLPGVPIDALLPPSAWALGCRDALTRGRDDAAAIEPKLATMPVDIETRTEREEVHTGAYPPIWRVAPIHVFVVRSTEPPKTKPTWQTFAMYELGGDHRTAMRAVGHVDAAILLDGWNPQQADAVIAAIEPALEPCFQPQ